MKLRDFKGLFKSNKTSFVSAENVYGDYYKIVLEKTDKIDWRPGEHGVFTLPNNKVKGKKFRAFSVASTSSENSIILGTRTGEKMSSFKEQLLQMKKGDTVKVRGPFGWFVEQDEKSPMVLIALGVGITPMRSLLVDLKENKNKKVDLLYSSSDFYMFKEEIDFIVDSNKEFDIKYLKTIEETNKSIKEKVDRYKNDAYYYISGNPAAINAIKKDLKAKGIKGKRIINDPFL